MGTQHMSSEELVLVSAKDGVGYVTLNRPKRGNALTSTMGPAVRDAVLMFSSDPEIHVIVLTGNGKYFCTGMDLGASNQGSVGSDLTESMERSRTFFETLNSCPKPIISRINGPVLGGGNGIVFTTDVRIAVKDTYFCFAEVKRGLIPALISAYIVPEMGAFKAKQYMLTGERVTAKSAKKDGWITAVAADTKELDALTEKYVQQLKSSAPRAMGNIKHLVAFTSAHGHEENKEYVGDAFLKMIRSKEAVYGITCFVKKEKPDWITFHKQEAKANL